MPRLRRLSGDEVVSILRRFGFGVHSQRGSHIKLRRLSPEGLRETISVPRHRQLAIGTLHHIYEQAYQYIPDEQLRPEFYTD